VAILLGFLAGAVLLCRAIGALLGPGGADLGGGEGVGALWVPEVAILGTWAGATLWGLALFFVLAGATHFTRMRSAFLRIVPAWVPNPAFAVTASGVCEILGGIGLLLPVTRFYAAVALLVFLVAIFPANVKAAREHISFAGRTSPPLWQRLPFQLLLMAMIAWSVFGTGGE
jgi:uncharacterized membrane protein